MKTRSRSVCQELLTWSKRKIGRATTCFITLTSIAGLVYLSWISEFNYALLSALSLILALAYTGGYRLLTPEIEGPKDREVVLLTGCDTGLGYSLALHSHSIGLRVIAGVHRKNSLGAHKLSAISGIFVHPVDITSNESVTNFRNAVRDYLQRDNLVLRAFVNNAGSMIFGEFEWQTEDQTRHQIEVNVIGTMKITRAFMPLIRAHFTRLIVVTSHCASEPLPGVATYGATKAALSAWATALRVELNKYHINVVSFVPGSFIHESNLLSRQSRHFETMELEMSDETRAFYGDYFTRYANYLSNLAPKDLPQKLTNLAVYEVFEGALFHRYPRAVYKCEPWRYMMYHILFKITPTSIRDQLVERFVQLPPWKQ